MARFNSVFVRPFGSVFHPFPRFTCPFNAFSSAVKVNVYEWAHACVLFSVWTIVGTVNGLVPRARNYVTDLCNVESYKTHLL